MHSENLDQLATALASAQAEFGAIPKTAENKFFKNNYADLATVVATASPILTKHGLSVSQHPSVDEHGFDTLTTWLLHTSGQFISHGMRLHLSKDDPQGHGSALTYARRYSYMAALGLVADDDDDGNRASKPQSRPKPVQATLDASSVEEVLQAVAAAKKGPEWLRSQLIAIGARDVPAGAIKKSTIQQLTPAQAAELVVLCAQAREAA